MQATSFENDQTNFKVNGRLELLFVFNELFALDPVVFLDCELPIHFYLGSLERQYLGGTLGGTQSLLFDSWLR